MSSSPRILVNLICLRMPANCRFWGTKLLTFLIKFFLVASVEASDIVCVIPADETAAETSGDGYITLLEPKTFLEFNSDNSVSKFQSPGCNKFRAISYWDDYIQIECESNNAELIKLKLSPQKRSFTKIYSNYKKEMTVLNGICTPSKN